MTNRKRTLWIWALLILGLVGMLASFLILRTSRGFLGLGLDPARVAGRETRMWKAYYENDVEALRGELAGLLTHEFGFSREDSVGVARSLGRAALLFHVPVPGSEIVVRKDLERAYGKIRDLTGGEWDPGEAARAELQWWKDRRDPERSDAETVGRSISELYTILSGRDNANIRRAGLLRAEAAVLRDSGGDWGEIERLLTESYRAFLEGAVE